MPSIYYIATNSGVEYSKRSHEPSNRQRAAWASEALETFRATVMPYEDNFTTLGDLLGDLMHWAKINRVDFDRALKNGRNHFEAEIWQELPEKKRKKTKRPLLAG